MNTLQEGDLLFALSQHAVEFAHAQLQQQGLNWPTAPRYFAIGRSTARRCIPSVEQTYVTR